MTKGFVPPPYPYDRLDKFKPLANKFEGGLVDLSIGIGYNASLKFLYRLRRLQHASVAKSSLRRRHNL